MKEEFNVRWRMLLWSGFAIGLASACLALFVFTVAGAALITVWVGLPIVFGTVLFVRPIADLHRRRAGEFLGEPIESPYLRRTEGNLLVRIRGLFRDPAMWRDTWWLVINGSLGLALAIVGVVEALIDLLFWWLPPGIALGVYARLARALLSPSKKSRLALRVEQLTESRAETVDTSAAELRRIERDLHDGAQARLVAIGMSLGLAEEQLARDPNSAKSLLIEARDTASDALAELRALVRGIHPPVLADRGLVEAVRALAGAVPIAVEVHADVPQRLPAPVESAAYFAVAEGLTNAIKHASAEHVAITIGLIGDDVELIVEDDGAGGADPALGTGLRGIARRLAAFDGTLTVDSPTGGPTRVVMVLRCASSSPKISPSSGTA